MNKKNPPHHTIEVPPYLTQESHTSDDATNSDDSSSFLLNQKAGRINKGINHRSLKMFTIVTTMALAVIFVTGCLMIGSSANENTTYIKESGSDIVGAISFKVQVNKKEEIAQEFIFIHMNGRHVFIMDKPFNRELVLNHDLERLLINIDLKQSKKCYVAEMENRMQRAKTIIQSSEELREKWESQNNPSATKFQLIKDSRLSFLLQDDESELAINELMCNRSQSQSMKIFTPELEKESFLYSKFFYIPGDIEVKGLKTEKYYKNLYNEIGYQNMTKLFIDIYQNPKS